MSCFVFLFSFLQHQYLPPKTNPTIIDDPYLHLNFFDLLVIKLMTTLSCIISCVISFLVSFKLFSSIITSSPLSITFKTTQFRMLYSSNHTTYQDSIWNNNLHVTNDFCDQLCATWFLYLYHFWSCHCPTTYMVKRLTSWISSWNSLSLHSPIRLWFEASMFTCPPLV
jgi:hypothetical protein